MSRKWLRCSLWGAATVMLGLTLAGPARTPSAWARQGSAGQQPQQAPAKTDSNQPPPEGTPTIRTITRIVTTPVTVYDSSGQFVYDLQREEFKVLDNGQPQRITDFDSEMRRISLVIVVETNDTTVPFLDSVRPLGSMFSDMVMGPQGEVAVLTYSDRVNLALDFTDNGDKLDTVLRGLQGRGGGMHLDDALTRALTMLDNRPKEDRKVIIIFSDGYNIGSKMSRGNIVKEAMNSDITIYGLGFSPLKGLWEKPAKDPQPDLVSESVARTMGPNQVPTPTNEASNWDTSDIGIVGILLGLGEEAKKPLFKSSLQYFARYSGGTAYQKWGKDTVQQALNQIATEIHSQYEIAYSPQSPIQVGYHRIEVEVRRPGVKVRARTGWFYQGVDVPRGVLVK